MYWFFYDTYTFNTWNFHPVLNWRAPSPQSSFWSIKEYNLYQSSTYTSMLGSLHCSFRRGILHLSSTLCKIMNVVLPLFCSRSQNRSSTDCHSFPDWMIIQSCIQVVQLEQWSFWVGDGCPQIFCSTSQKHRRKISLRYLLLLFCNILGEQQSHTPT